MTRTDGVGDSPFYFSQHTTSKAFRLARVTRWALSRGVIDEEKGRGGGIEQLWAEIECRTNIGIWVFDQRQSRRLCGGEMMGDRVFKLTKGSIAELCGWYGMLSIIGAYALVSFEAVRPDGLPYQLLNLSGAIGLLVISIAKRVKQNIDNQVHQMNVKVHCQLVM